METFEEKLEEASIQFSSALKKFKEETTPPMLGFLAIQIQTADEFRKADIEVAC